MRLHGTLWQQSWHHAVFLITGEAAAVAICVKSDCLCSVHRGWNCIDTASNYRGSRAERAVGDALDALLSSRLGITRNMLFIRWAVILCSF